MHVCVWLVVIYTQSFVGFSIGIYERKILSCWKPLLLFLVPPKGPCDKSDNGGCGHMCTNTASGEAKCSCKSGYFLDRDGKTCKSKYCLLTLLEHLSTQNGFPGVMM